MKTHLFQTEQEREWFAAAFERRDKIRIPDDRKVELAKLLLRCQVGCEIVVISGGLCNCCNGRWALKLFQKVLKLYMTHHLVENVTDQLFLPLFISSACQKLL